MCQSWLSHAHWIKAAAPQWGGSIAASDLHWEGRAQDKGWPPDAAQTDAGPLPSYL